MIGSNEDIDFKQPKDDLKLLVPANRPKPYTMVFKVE